MVKLPEGNGRVKETLNLLNLPSNPYTYVNHARLRANVPFDASFFKWFLLGLNKKRYRFVFHLLESYPFHPPLSFFFPCAFFHSEGV